MSKHGYYRHAERSFDRRLGIVRKSGAVRLGKTIVPAKHAFVPPSTDGYYRHKLKEAREGPGSVTEQRATQGQAGLPSTVVPHTQRQIAAPVPQFVDVSIGGFTFRWPDLKWTGGRLVA